MEKIKVIFRKFKNPYMQQWEVEAFFPELSVNYGNILNYAHFGQYSEASIGHYYKTKKASIEEYSELLKELISIYSDCKLDIKQRLNYDDLRYKAWSI